MIDLPPERLCDICMKQRATLADCVREGGKTAVYAYCESCYRSALKRGVIPAVEAKARLERRGLECPACGMTIERARADFMLGCPECYEHMRQALRPLVPTPVHSSDREEPRYCGDDMALVKTNVVSSRIRLARNVRGLEFPARIRNLDGRVKSLIEGAEEAAEGVFKAQLYTMSSLDNLKKKLLLERHVVSLPLTNNPLGAVLLESGENPEISVMLNEEDHIRAQCIVGGAELERAYDRLKRYDDRLKQKLDIAYDEEFGYITACPSNLGTGMRASMTLFLPAIKRAGAIEDAVRTFKRSGLAVRGYFGEGSEAAYDMYQISNSVSFGADEGDIIRDVGRAAIAILRLEHIALEKLVREQKTQLIDGIFRSYATLKGAYSLSAQELMRLTVDAKLGVILDVLPLKDIGVLNKLIGIGASTVEILTDGIDDEERNVLRAALVKKCLAEVEC